MTEGKWLRFEDEGPTAGGKTRTWRVVNKQYGDELGRNALV